MSELPARGFEDADLVPLVEMAIADWDGARLSAALLLIQLPPSNDLMVLCGLESESEWYALIREWLVAAADQGFIAAIMALGRISFHGLHGREPDFREALSQFQKIERLGRSSPVLDYYIACCSWCLERNSDRGPALERLRRAISGGYVFGMIQMAEFLWEQGDYLRSIGTRIQFSAAGLRVLLLGKKGDRWRVNPPLLVYEVFATDELARRRRSIS